MSEHRPTAYLPDNSPHTETCRECDEPWPCLPSHAAAKASPCCPTLPWCTVHDCCPWDCWDFTTDAHKPAPAA